MRRSWFMQMLWKEYREQRAFWLATTLIIAVTQAISQYWYSLEPRGAHSSWTAAGGWSASDGWVVGFWLALGAPAFYAAGVGATLFATEHERGTFAFLRALRCRPGQLAIPKFAFAVLSVAGMQAVLWLAAGAMSLFRFPPASQVWGSFKFWEPAAILSLAWGGAFSMLLREPLRAVALTLLATAITVSTAPWLAAEFGLQSGSDRDPELMRGLTVQCFWLALLAPFDLWLARRWAVEAVPRSSTALRSARQAKRDRADRHRSSRSRRGIEFTLDFLRQTGALCWQAWRGASAWAWLLGALAALMLAIEIFNVRIFERTTDSFLSVWKYLFVLVMLLPVTIAALCGGLAFRVDQQREGRRFLAERGVSPRYLWLSRQVVWSAIAAACAAIVLILPIAMFVRAAWSLLAADPPLFDGTFSRIPGADTPWWSVARNDAVYFALFGPTGLLTLLACLPLAYAAGQWMSLCVRSSLIAVLAAMLLAAAGSAWTMLMASLEISLLWSVLPIFVALLAASWLRAPLWLVDRRALITLIAPTTPVLLTVLTLAVAVPLYRATEIPATTFQWAPSDTSAERTAASENEFHLSRIADRIIAEPLNGDSMSPQAGRMRSADEEPAAEYRAWETYLGEFRRAQQSNRGMPRELLRGLPYWAAKNDQTSEQIRRAISELWQFRPLAISQAKAALRREYEQQSRIIDDLPSIIKDSSLASRELRSDVVVLEQRLPWERIRARRLLDWVTKSDLEFIENVEHGLDNDDVRALFHEHFFDSDRILVRGMSVSPLRENFERWSRTTPLFVLVGPNGPDLAWLAAIADSQFRATIILMALEDWKRERGRLPKYLGQLIGDYFPRLPLDPLTGSPFVYYPSGVAFELQLKGFPLRETARGFPRLPAGTPFLWSVAGPGRMIPAVRDERHSDNSKDPTPYRSTSSTPRAFGESISLDAALELGCFYVIP